MIPLEDAVIARYSHSGSHFEVLVGPDAAQEIKKKGSISDLDACFASGEVFSDSNKGMRAAESDINRVFGTIDFSVIAIRILQKGEIQLTTDQRRKMLHNKKQQIITRISRFAVDPRTHTPHPPLRIEKAIDEAKVHIDPFKTAEEQVEGIIKLLKPILPISMEVSQVMLRIPTEFTGRAYSVLREHKTIKEEWQNDGSLKAVIELPAGLQGEFFDKLNKATQGNVQSEVVPTR